MAAVNFVNGGVTNGDRSVASNYSTGVLPTAADDVTQTVASTAGSCTCNSWSAASNTIGGAGTITGNVIISAAATALDTVTITGNLTVGGGGGCTVGNVGMVTVGGIYTQNTGFLKRITVAGQANLNGNNSPLAVTNAIFNGPAVVPGSLLNSGNLAPSTTFTNCTFNGGLVVTVGGLLCGSSKAINAGLVPGVNKVLGPSVSSTISN